MQQHQVFFAVVAVLAWSGFLLGHSYFAKTLAEVNDPSAKASSAVAFEKIQNRRTLSVFDNGVPQSTQKRNLRRSAKRTI